MLDRWIGFVLLAGVVSSVLSIFVSDTFFCVAMLLWLVDCWKRKKVHLRFPPFFGFVLAFLLLVVGAVAFSDDVSISLPYLKRLIKYSYIFLIFTYVKPQWVEQALRAIFALLAGSSLYGILQYLWLMDVTLLNRIDGFMGHWMTFSGQLMMCSVALVGYLLFYRLPAMSSQGTATDSQITEGPKPHRLWNHRELLGVGGWTAVLVIFLLALVLTQTRNAWLGTVGGLFLLLWIHRFRWMVAGMGILIVIFLALPGHFKQRLYSGFDSSDTTTRIRIELFHTGSNIIKEHPWWGVGPRMVPRIYHQYNGTDELPRWIYQHLHNNFLHIAAEMGLITLGAWMALWIRLLRDFIRFRRSTEIDQFPSGMATIGIGVVSSFLLAGLFEYNFGDSEILILLLFFVTVPYVLKYPREETS